MATLEISIIPIGTGSTSVGSYVADCHRWLQSQPGLRFELGAMGTVVEADADTLFDVARQLHELCFCNGVRRVYTVIKIDDRRDRESGIDYKIASVREKLQAP